MLSAGADGAIKSVFENFTKKGDGILRFEPTFAMYSIYPKIYGLKDIVINYTKSKNGPYLDQEVFLKKIKKSKPKLICIANPNSPAGTILKKNEMIKVFRLAKQMKSIILLDEAYYPYYKHTYKSLINKFDNLVIVRTTKSFGMSGMRVGYLISNKNTYGEIFNVAPGKTISLNKPNPLHETFREVEKVAYEIEKRFKK